MISIQKVIKFCRDDISKIENYEKALADKTRTWHCHHRLELTLNGEFAHTREDLKRMEMYYNRPFFELIFLTPTEHKRLHNKCMSAETRDKISASEKGKKVSYETRAKIGASHKGMKHSAEARANISAGMKGKPSNTKGKHWYLENGKRVYSKEA